MLSRTSIHFDRAAYVAPPQILIRTLNDVRKLLTPEFLANHDFHSGTHAAVVRPSDFGLKGAVLPCAILAQKTIDGKIIQNIYMSPRASEFAFKIVQGMNSMDSRRVLNGFKEAYNMNVHYSGKNSWGKAKHPWQRNSNA